MNDQSILEELLALLDQNGISIRHESISGSAGGLCNIKGKKVYFVDKNAPAVDSAALCADAVRQIIDTESIYIKPAVREFLDAAN